MSGKRNSSLLKQKASIRTWTLEELKLIENVKLNPDLYNGADLPKEHYDAYWEAIASKMELPVLKCRKRWMALRRCYIKHYTSYSKYSTRRAKTKLADGTLTFLDDFINISSVLRRRTLKKSNKEGKGTCNEMNPNLSEKVLHYSVCNDHQIYPPNNTRLPMPLNTSNTVMLSNPNKIQSNRTVLTQDIIEYLLKSKSNEPPKESHDIFESIASLVPCNSTGKPIIQSSGNVLAAPIIQPTIINAFPINQQIFDDLPGNVNDDGTSAPRINGDTITDVLETYNTDANCEMEEENDDDEDDDNNKDNDDDVHKIEIKEEPEEEYLAD